MGANERHKYRGESMNHIRHIQFTFIDEEVSVDAELLENEAPHTCDTVWENLPLEGFVQHGIYSGSEIYLLLPELLSIEPENATSAVAPGDVGYYAIHGGEEYGWPTDLSELCIFYDRDAEPRMPGGPVRVNVFARMAGNADRFFGMCRKMRIEGRKRFQVTRAINS